MTHAYYTCTFSKYFKAIFLTLFSCFSNPWQRIETKFGLEMRALASWHSICNCWPSLQLRPSDVGVKSTQLTRQRNKCLLASGPYRPTNCWTIKQKSQATGRNWLSCCALNGIAPCICIYLGDLSEVGFVILLVGTRDEIGDLWVRITAHTKWHSDCPLTAFPNPSAIWTLQRDAAQSERLEQN